VLLHTGMRALETPLFPESYGRLASVGMCPDCRDGGCVLFIGLTAEPYHTHAIWYGMMNTLGIFRIDRLDPEDLAIYTRRNRWN